jgi:hypothetical protein
MINCRNCVNWIDESLAQVAITGNDGTHIFMGCRLYGHIENSAALESCPSYEQSANLFSVCGTCGITVPKVCISLGECLNCTDTDLFCVDQCVGGDSRKHCGHFVRIHSEGVHLISGNEAFELFPQIGMPGRRDPDGGRDPGREGQGPETVTEPSPDDQNE